MKSDFENKEKLQAPSTREILDKYEIMAKKSFGQNFILDDNITAKIVRIAGITGDDTVIEIGPGPGSLTKHLLAAAKKVVVIEKDKRFFEPLAEVGSYFPGKLEVLEQDALDFNFGAIKADSLKLVSNLPYNISTPILVMLLREIDNFKSFTLMFQVAERIIAKPCSKEYGRLSVLAQWLTDVEKAYTLPPEASPQNQKFIQRY